MPRWLAEFLSRLVRTCIGGSSAPGSAHQPHPEPSVWVRVAAVSVSLTAGQTGDHQAVLSAYEALVIQAAAQGARLIVLPAQLVLLDNNSYHAFIARVRHWARQSQAWIVLGYSLTGSDGGGRLLAIDPTGSLVSGRDARGSPPETVSPAAQFSRSLTLEGWCLNLTQGRGLLAFPTTAKRSARLSALLGRATGAAVICAGRDGVWISTGEGFVQSGRPTETGARMIVHDLRAAEGRTSSPSNHTP